MSLFFHKKKGRTLSVDVGSLTAKALVTEGVFPDSLRVMDFRVVHLREKNQMMSTEDIASVLHHTFQDLQFNPATVRSVVTTRQEVVRVVEMPYTNRNELKKTARYQLSRHVPFNQSDAVFDCVPLDNSEDNEKKGGNVKCLLVAVRRDIIDAHNTIFKESNVVPLLLDVEPVAVMNAYLAAGIHFEREQGLQQLQNEGVALIHIGAQHTDLSVLQGRMPVACRAIEFDMQQTALLLDESSDAPHSHASETSEIQLERYMAQLITELKASLNYCARHYNVSIARVIISGGGAVYEDIRALLESQLNIPTFRFDPFIKTDLTPLDTRIGEFRALSASFTAAMGVAVRHISP